MKISPSLMCMDLSKFREQIEFLDSKVDYFHVDIMDGHFVPNITLSPFFVSEVRKISSKPIDCHLMVTNPENYIEQLAKSGASMITLHPETINGQAFRLFDQINALSMKVGIIFNPETSLDAIKYYAHRINKATVMTVDPGFAGQPFISEMMGKVGELRQLRDENQLDFEIEIDGSCNERTYRTLAAAKVDVFIVGTSGLFGLNQDIRKSWDKMTGLIGQSYASAVS